MLKHSTTCPDFFSAPMQLYIVFKIISHNLLKINITLEMEISVCYN